MATEDLKKNGEDQTDKETPEMAPEDGNSVDTSSDADKAAQPAEVAGKPGEVPKDPDSKQKTASAKGAGFLGTNPESKVETTEVERVIKIRRVAKVVKGGKNFSFSALVITGDGNGNVGIGLGKSNEVVEAIKKGTSQANKSRIAVNLKKGTIPHETIGRFKASRVILKPAGPGTGVIAGGPVRAMCDAAGIRNILTKTLGSRNAVNVVKATENGFRNLVLQRKGEGTEK